MRRKEEENEKSSRDSSSKLEEVSNNNKEDKKKEEEKKERERRRAFSLSPSTNLLPMMRSCRCAFEIDDCARDDTIIVATEISPTR